MESLKDELLEEGYEPAGEVVEWNGEYQQLMIDESDNHYVFIDKNGDYITDGWFDE